MNPFLLPVTTLRLAGRFIVPLTLWFTVGELLRFVLLLYGTALSLRVPWLTMVGLSLLVMISLGTTVAMLHSVRSGLPHRSARPWTAPSQESILDALGRALLPFMIIYVSWRFFAKDAEVWVNEAVDRAQATQEDWIAGSLKAMQAVLDLQERLPLAIGLTVLFFVLAQATARWVVPRLPRLGGILGALWEINWTLFGIFTVDHLIGTGTGWITQRRLWTTFLPDWDVDWLPVVKEAFIGPLIWLVIAGVVLGMALDRGREPGQALVRAATRETREKFVPAWNGLRLIWRAGPLTFAVFAVLFVLVDRVGPVIWRQTAEFLGPHPPLYWEFARIPLGYVSSLVETVLWVCLLAATFDLVVARVSARSTERPAAEAAPTTAQAVPS